MSDEVTFTFEQVVNYTVKRSLTVSKQDYNAIRGKFLSFHGIEPTPIEIVSNLLIKDYNDLSVPDPESLLELRRNNQKLKFKTPEDRKKYEEWTNED